MKRTKYDHSKLEGMDADLETSLKEYGLAWIETDTEYLFYYGIEYGPEQDDLGLIEDCYITFDFCSLDKNLNVKKEFDWVNYSDVESHTGMRFDDMLFAQKIADLISYYSAEDVFGSTYYEGLTYDEIVPKDQ